MKKALLFMLGMLLTAAASAQSWPQKPVRFIVPFPPGGATDISARLLGERLSQMWGQQVVIENRGGAGGGVGAAEAARAAPDGYTLFFPSGSVMTANQHIYAKMNYNPEKDFVPVTNVVSGLQVLTVPASSLRSPASTSATPIRIATCASWPQACITPTSAPRQCAVTFEAKGRPVSSFTGSASMSARSATTGPGLPPVRTATTPVMPTSVRTS